MKNKDKHTFHIPVMGLGFTVDTPVKVAKYGISSVISIVDDFMIEKMREAYCRMFNKPFNPISRKSEDFRAERITSYLNLIDEVVKEKFEELKNSIHEKSHELEKYFDMLPDFSGLKQKYKDLVQNNHSIKEIQAWLHKNLSLGSIDVNIMTKLDKPNFNKKEQLPVEFNDAHAALRGFAKSNLNSSIVLSAGMNPRLYGYMEKFNDFFPDEEGNLKKKITLKVSDYRSALIQGKFLAKKGLWVSEFRIESGLNCGGHAFASDGFLLGPILVEFKNKREELIQTLFEIYEKGLKNKNRLSPGKPSEIMFTAQGGVGTAEEHQFLVDHYNLDSIGWGSPFLLVPEVSIVDDETRELLRAAREEDLYLSSISPLGVPFNSLKGSSQDIITMERVEAGKPGSPCPKKYLVSNTEFTENYICTASSQYQKIKLKELDENDLSAEDHKKQFNKIVEKSCLCVGLSASALIVNKMPPESKEKSVAVCPGPNLAYFSEIVSLKQMIDHIYGRINIIKRNDRPNLFIKEIKIYIDYFKNKIEESSKPITDKQAKYFDLFQKNMMDGIEYYKELFSSVKENFEDIKSDVLRELEELEFELKNINLVLVEI